MLIVRCCPSNFIGLEKKLLSFPNMAYIVAGFIVLVGIVVLFMFLRRRKRDDRSCPDGNGLQLSFENEIYSLETTDKDHTKSAVNRLYMSREECANFDNRDEKNDVTEC